MLKYVTSPVVQQAAIVEANSKNSSTGGDACSQKKCTDSSQQPRKPHVTTPSKTWASRSAARRMSATMDMGTLAEIKDGVNAPNIPGNTSSPPSNVASQVPMTEEEIMARCYPSWKNMEIDDLEDESTASLNASDKTTPSVAAVHSASTVPFVVPDRSKWAGITSMPLKKPAGILDGIKNAFRRSLPRNFKAKVTESPEETMIVYEGHRQYTCDGGVVMF